MKQVLTLILLISISADAHAFIRLSFPDFFAGNSIGIKGNVDAHGDFGGSAYADVAFLMFTLGVEGGHNRFSKYGTTARYNYLEPYLGLQLPVDNWAVYARFGLPFILGNTNDFKYTDKTAMSVETGWRSVWFDSQLLLGTGVKWHLIDYIVYEDSRFSKTSGMFFINIGYYWNWQ